MLLWALPVSVPASIIHTLNGIEYEWLEISETRGLSRDQVEVMLADTDSVLFGYQYASRSLVQDLLYSYAPWDGVTGAHGAPDVVQGISSLLADLGGGLEINEPEPMSTTTQDGYTAQWVQEERAYLWYGADTDVCPGSGAWQFTDEPFSCYATLAIYLDRDGQAVMAYQSARSGWDASTPMPTTAQSWARPEGSASFLVRELVSPVPLAPTLGFLSSGLMWLFVMGRLRHSRNDPAWRKGSLSP